MQLKDSTPNVYFFGIIFVFQDFCWLSKLHMRQFCVWTYPDTWKVASSEKKSYFLNWYQAKKVTVDRLMFVTEATSVNDECWFSLKTVSTCIIWFWSIILGLPLRSRSSTEPVEQNFANNFVIVYRSGLISHFSCFNVIRTKVTDSNLAINKIILILFSSLNVASKINIIWNVITGFSP